MQTATSTEIRFVRRTTLKAGESRCNFRQIDRDALRLVRSKQARAVTKLMAHIYLCLVDAPFKYYESEGVLRFAGEVRDGKHMTAWDQLIELLEVADGTANKAIEWLRKEEVIGYFAGKNGAGIRIWLNRAASSIKQSSQSTQKILAISPVANCEARVSPNATPLSEHTRRTLDTKIKTFAPKNGADAYPPDESLSNRTCSSHDASRQDIEPVRKAQSSTTADLFTSLPPNVVAQIRDALEPQLRTIAAQVASREAAREGERTRQWLDRSGIPKAVRVAQREAYSVFKHESTKGETAGRARAESQIGRLMIPTTLDEAKPCTASEISEFAEVCVTLLELQGKPIDATLAEISKASGGWVMAEDVPKVREAAYALVRAKSE